MNKTNKIFITSLAVILAIASGVTAISYNQQDSLTVQYIPSDLNNAYSNYEVIETGAASWATTDIKKVKDQVDYTVKGTVVAISEPMPWLVDQNESDSYKLKKGENIRIEIDIKVEKAKTHKHSNKPDLEVDSIITVTITGKLKDNVINLQQDEDQYEIGEKVIVHIAEDPHDIVGKDINYNILAKYSKYKIQGDKAFNDKNKNGKSSDSAFNEAN